ncbi:DNA polymerase II, large subunit DP2 [Methanocaldococcus vulcanius M7]|uniref:DNA polymerase II large subunit n=1 Tax=Methanocaldococcus vulcanius (strain ATCC 700851 / DSM 12094 / M7) TaxID=579137 RepID=C9RGL5_METVM|nr:DNA-directed DNA polymerase II large subunit [Methanocaldococcus vulcanius]ACX72717.1 DNA polymerase II, large subunit DP2 [Methanocaldococcus vulcanius M7]
MIHVACSENMRKYFENIVKEVEKLYKIAEECRSRGFDPTDEVEIPLAVDMADRVEGLVGPKGVAKRIRELVKELGKEPASLEIAKEIVEGKFGNFEKEKKAEQAVRTALAVLTEGIVAAPLEGIADVKIKKNPDGTEYLAIYYAGPIRSAGGTAQALSVLVGDFVRKAMNLDKYKPTEDEIERYVEEVELYQSEVGSFQYSPTADEIRTAIRNIPIEITGEATDNVEVSGHRDLPRVETNQIRGGALLVLVEGVLLKAPKILRHVDKLGIEGWDWLKDLKGKKDDNKSEEKVEDEEIDEENDEELEGYWRDVNIEANKKFISEVIAGRPVFAHPSKVGGFRLRYGRSRNTGFATQGFHPALMYLVDEFMAVGTQLKTERPGKATCVVPVDSIEPPIVRLKNGDVVRVETAEKAIELRNRVDEILFLGDVLVNYGDFLENNHPLLPSCWCEEWYEQLLKSKNISYNEEFIGNPRPDEAVKFALETKTPLHPRFTYHWHDVSKEEIILLRNWLLKGKEDNFEGKKVWIVDLETEEDKKAKRVLELIGCCHLVRNKKVVIEEYYPLLYSLGFDVENKKDLVENIEETANSAKNSIHFVNLLSPFEVRRNTYVYVGARMGRPEKAAPRKMKPPVNGLFPIGNAGGQVRLINKAVEENNTDDIDVSYAVCPKCEKISLYRVCPFCGTKVELNKFGKIKAPLKDYWYNALKRLGINKPGDVKCIKGMTSKQKIVEPLEKAILRAMNEVYVFKDGTTRFDCTDVPITHFKPSEINVSVEKLKELGYEKDIHGRELVDEDQVLELKPQDVIIPENCAEYFVKVANFIDELLEKLYKMDRFYNVKEKKDLIGHLVIGMAPHTSAGMVGRIIGYTEARVGYAHPYFHAAKRRNCFPGDTRILVNIDGNVERITLKELYELFDEKYEVFENDAFVRKKPLNNKNIKVYSFNPEHKNVVLTDIEEVIKLESPNHQIKITLDGNREFITTHDHSVMVYENGKFIKKLAMDVKEGDLMLIPKVDFEEDNIEEFDLLKEFSKEEFKDLWSILRVIGISNWIKENIGKELIRELKLDEYLKYDTIPLDKLLILLEKSNLTIDEVPKNCYIAVKDDKTNINRIIKIEPLLKLIGYYLSEGYARESKTVYQINFSNSEEEIRENIKKSIKEAFGGINVYESKEEGKLSLSSRVVYLFFTRVLKIGKNAKSKRIPSFIFKLPKEKVKLMLSAYFDVEGSISNTKPRISVYSINKTLLEDIDLLLNRFGIKTYWIDDKNVEGGGKENPKLAVYALNISGYYCDIFFKEIGFFLKRKQMIYELHKNKVRKNDSTEHNFGWIVKVKKVEIIKSNDEFIYTLNAKKYHNVIINENIQTFQCDGDEDSFFLLLDAFLNFSKKFLPDKRGGQMDAPLVLTTILDPKEVDGEVHNMDTMWSYPLEFYEKTLEMPSPKDVKDIMETVEDRLGKPEQYEGIGYTHETSRVDLGPKVCAYKTLGSMLEKTASQLLVAKKIRATDEKDVAEKVIQSHFIPDLIGNLRAFSRQSVRCKCGAKFRRVPLRGKCPKCGSKLILTVSKGAVEKYMDVAEKMAEQYDVNNYIKQRLKIIREGINSIFENDKSKQVKLSDFFKIG